MKVGIVGQRGNRQAVSLVGEITARLRENGMTAVVDETTHELLQTVTTTGTPLPDGIAVEELSTCDLAVSVGGDGTFLYTARGAETTPILGVNLGEVGFLNAVSPERAVEAVEDEMDRMQSIGSPRTRPLPRLAAAGPEWTLSPALNEVVVQGPQRGHGNGLTAEIRVDGSLYSDGHADGVLVATPTGSTAYNLSEGGPIVHPDVGGFVVTEMCGESGMSPLVVGRDAEVAIRVTEAETAVAISDGRVKQTVTPPAEIVISRAERPVLLAGPRRDFFAALDKLD